MSEQDANAAPRPLKIARGVAPRIHLTGKIKPFAQRGGQNMGRTFVFAPASEPETKVAPFAPQKPAAASPENRTPALTTEDEAALVALFDAIDEAAPQMLASEQQIGAELRGWSEEVRASRLTFADEAREWREKIRALRLTFTGDHK